MRSRSWALLAFAGISLLLGWIERRPPRWMLEDPLRHPFAMEWLSPDLPVEDRPEAEDSAPKYDGPVDVNRDGPERLRTLPGVGAVTATRILELRERRGPLTCAEDLLAVRGIGPKTLEKMRPRLRFSSAMPDSD